MFEKSLNQPLLQLYQGPERLRNARLPHETVAEHAHKKGLSLGEVVRASRLHVLAVSTYSGRRARRRWSIQTGLARLAKSVGASVSMQVRHHKTSRETTVRRINRKSRKHGMSRLSELARCGGKQSRMRRCVERKTRLIPSQSCIRKMIHNFPREAGLILKRKKS